MAIVMEAFANEFTEITDYGLFAELRFGGNGAPDATPEYDIGIDPEDLAWDRLTWDGQTGDGIDSSWLEVDFWIDLDNDTASWTVGGATEIYASPTAFNTIDQIKIRAAVSTQAAMLWEDLDVTFFSDNQVVDQLTDEDGPDVDQTSQQGAGDAQDILTITPEASGVDKVHVTGLIRLLCPQGVGLDDNSIFSQIFVFGS